MAYYDMFMIMCHINIMFVDNVICNIILIYVSHKSTFSSTNSTQITGGVLASKFKMQTYDVCI